MKKMYKLSLGLLLIIFLFTTNIFAQSPGGVAGANLWLKANDGATNSGSNLTGWTDKTGTNTFTVNGTIGYATNTINFNPVVSFNNTDALTDAPSNRLDGNTSITAVDGFAVYKYTSATNRGALAGDVIAGSAYGKVFFSAGNDPKVYVGSGNWTEYQSYPNTNLDNKFTINNFDISEANAPYATGRLNGQAQTVANGGGSDFTSLALTPRIGGTNNNGSSAANGWYHFRGEVAEMIFFPSSLNTADKLKVESYLALKYGISLGNNENSVDYISSSGTKIWDGTANATYKYDIFGIGKDDNSGLNQTSSNSMNTGNGDGTGQSGKGNIVISNPSDMADGEFLLVGSDNGSLTYSTTELDGTLSGEYQRIAREWFVDKTNDVGSVTLTFDMTGITTVGSSTPSDFGLLTNTNNNFSSGATRINATSINGNVITFTGLTLADGQYLTFIAKVSALPVELTSFTATSLENKVVLNWETATEVNNYGFEIERTAVESLLATTPVWETLGFVEGCGNSNSPKSYEFVDETPLQDAAEYRLKQIDTDGNSSYYSQTAQVGGFGTTDIKDNQLPKEYALEQNYPNPFNPSTIISYAIPNSGMVELSVYDILGKEVAVLVNQEKQAGNYNVEFNASNLTSGVYFYKIQAGNFSSFKKMLLVK